MDNKVFSRNLFQLLSVFLICFCYWGYHYANSTMLISQDAIGYEEIATVMKNEGLKGYLKDDLTREPLYPLTISYSMRIAEIVGMPYQKIQMLFQFGALFITQVLLYYLLTVLKIDSRIKNFTVLYYGFSPAILNSALSLYSEIAALPFVLLIVISAYKSWDSAPNGSYLSLVSDSILTAIAFLGAIFVKAIFQYIFLLYIIIFLIRIGVAALKKNMKLATNMIVYVFLSVSIVGGSCIYYRYLNLKYNGHFDFANRYDSLLYGNAGKRTEKLDGKKFMAHIVSIPGENFCRRFYSADECDYCTFKYADYYRGTFLNQHLIQLPHNQWQTKTLKLTIEKIFEKPVQYAVLTILEALKMGFWESTNIGFVDYPPFIDRFYENGIIRNGIRLFVSVLTYVSLIYAFVFVIMNYKKGNRSDEVITIRLKILAFVFLIIMSFTALYSLFSILTRFSFPIVSLYFICFACLLQSKLNK